MLVSEYPKPFQPLIQDIIETAEANEVTIKMGKGRRINMDGIRVGGYFDDVNRVLAVATNHPTRKWIEILIHESCHMDQWLEQSRYWNTDLDDAINLFHEYIVSPNEYDKSTVSDAVDMIVTMEADCESRAYKKIIHYDLPIDVSKYAQKANAYLLSHKAMLHYGQWYKIGPYRIPGIIKMLPTTISAPYTYKMKYNKIDPRVFEKAFRV